jgi:hypothetical protein
MQKKKAEDKTNMKSEPEYNSALYGKSYLSKSQNYKN